MFFIYLNCPCIFTSHRENCFPEYLIFIWWTTITLHHAHFIPEIRMWLDPTDPKPGIVLSARWLKNVNVEVMSRLFPWPYILFWNEFRGGQQRWSECSSYEDRVRELGLFRLKKRRLWKCLRAALLYLKVVATKLGRDFFHHHVVIGKGEWL